MVSEKLQRYYDRIARERTSHDWSKTRYSHNYALQRESRTIKITEFHQLEEISLDPSYKN